MEKPLDILKKKFGEPSRNKGNVRRKVLRKTKKKTPDILGKLNSAVQKYNKSYLDNTKVNFTYLNVFTGYFCGGINKFFKKNNKVEHHHEIKTKLTTYLTLEGSINSELIGYLLKNVNETAIEDVISILDIITAMVCVNEGNDFVLKSDYDDDLLKSSYEILNKDYNVKTDPVNLRRHYLDSLKTILNDEDLKVNRQKMTNAYYIILNTIL